MFRMRPRASVRLFWARSLRMVHLAEMEAWSMGRPPLLLRMSVIETLTEAIAVRAPRVAEEYRKKLADRIQEFLAGKADEARILTEAAIFADKCSIDEELTRLRAHIKAFREICLLEQVGRKLDFLVQEFNRECNTICSKSSDQEITANALQMKNEIEKVREQIQNLE